MSTEASIIFGVTLYKLACLFIGFGFCWMGYRLFVNGIWGNAGDFEAQFKDNKLIMKRAAPGTFFALFGAIIVSLTILKGLDFKSYTSVGPRPIIPTKTSEEPLKLPDKPGFKN